MCSKDHGVLFEFPIIEEASESPHHAAVWVVIALVLITVDHIIVTADDPGAWLDSSYLSHIVGERDLVASSCGAYTQVNHQCPQGKGRPKS